MVCCSRDGRNPDTRTISLLKLYLCYLAFVSGEVSHGMCSHVTWCVFTHYLACVHTLPGVFFILPGMCSHITWCVFILLSVCSHITWRVFTCYLVCFCITWHVTWCVFAGAKVCFPGQFKCHDGGCVQAIQMCDLRSDCKDGTDEHLQMCTDHVCLPYQFRCGSGQCILSSWECDNNRDCIDGTDEFPLNPRCCKWTCIHAYKKERMHACMDIATYTCIHTYILKHTRTHTRTHTCTHAHTHI